MNTNNTPIKIFLTGSSGYIGGTVFSKLLEPAHQGKYDISVLTRSESSIPKYKELGVTPVIGTLDSADILTQAAIDADVVMHFADSADHLPSAKAFVKGLNTNDGKRRIYIHTSGTSVLADKAMGNYVSDKIYSDLDMDSINALPITQPHKDVDIYIFENNKGFDSILVAPPNIYGEGAGPFNRRSIQIPSLIKGILKVGRAATIGKGLNVWNNVHVDDLGNFYVLLLEKALEGKASTGKDGWYFCETGEHAWKDIVIKIAEELHKQGKLSDTNITEFTQEEIDDIFGDMAWHALGSNSRSKADRARQLGFKSDERNPSVFDTIADEVKAILENKDKDK